MPSRKVAQRVKPKAKKTTTKKGSKKSRSTVRIHLKKGGLARFDRAGNVVEEYHLHYQEKKRHSILQRVVADRQGNALAVFRRLIALRTLGKHRLSDEQKNLLTRDAEFIKRKYYGTSYWRYPETPKKTGKKKKSVGYDDDDEEGDSSSSSSSSSDSDSE